MSLTKAIYIGVIATFGLFSCQNFKEEKESSAKDLAKKEVVYKTLSEKWQFHFPKNNSEVDIVLNQWNEWQQFAQELQQKPKTSLLAFQMKVKNASLLSEKLHVSVPETFNNRQVRARLIALETKLKSLETYINLSDIPTKKVVKLISEANAEITASYRQFEEIIIKNTIPKEVGEDELLRALDTTRHATEKAFEKSVINSQNNQEEVPDKIFLKKIH